MSRKTNNKSIVYIGHYNSPLGKITMASDGEALIGLWFDGQTHFGSAIKNCEIKEASVPVFNETKKWLDIYFSGNNPGFMPPIKFNATPFRKEIWNILLSIPYGKTKTYSQIAKEIAEQKGISKMSAQAVGGAVGHNPISLIIPCHRVVGTNGNLTGYAGGLDRKISLLRLEGINITTE